VGTTFRILLPQASADGEAAGEFRHD